MKIVAVTYTEDDRVEIVVELSQSEARDIGREPPDRDEMTALAGRLSDACRALR